MNRALKLVALIAIAVVLYTFPDYASSQYVLTLGTEVAINAIFLTGLNVAVGEAGLVSVAQGAFLMIGAYATGLLTIDDGWGFWATIPVAIVAAAVAGMIIGAITLRLAGHYFVIATLALGIVVSLIIGNWSSLTGGYDGLSPIPYPSGTAGAPANFYLLALTVALIVAVGVQLLLGTGTGVRLRSIRENSVLAAAVGVNVYRTRLVAFSISAAIAGLAGSLDASFLSYIDPTLGDYNVSFQALMALIVGGQGSVVGPFVGSGLFILIPEALRSSQQLSTVIFGVVLIVVVMIAPDGIWGRAKALALWVRMRLAPPAAARGAAAATVVQPAGRVESRSDAP